MFIAMHLPLSTILAQAKLPTDTIAASKIEAATARVDSLTQTLTNPDSLANLTPSRVMSALHDMDWGSVITSLSSQFISLGLRILAAIAIFYIGRFIIRKIHNVLRAIMIAKDFDQSLASFLLSFIKITLLFLLIITVIGVMGIETSSFIAIFASAGVAIGMALSGTLQNFAGGVLLLLIKPYKVGDYIVFGEHKGFVKEIQIFHTIITTYNNERIIIPNGGLSTGTINNFSTEKYHRLEWRVAISYGDDVDLARHTALAVLASDPRIATGESDVKEDVPDEAAELAQDNASTQEEHSWLWRLFHRSRRRAAEWRATKQAAIESKIPKPNYKPYVAVESLDDSSVTLIVRAWALTSDYWSVLYAINEKIYNEFPRNGLHFPFPQMDVHINNQSS